MKYFFETMSEYTPDHADYSKCGTCWLRVIQSEVAKDFLKSGTTGQDDYEAFQKAVQERWRETALYKRVQSLREGGMDMDGIADLLMKEGIEV